MPVSTNMKLFEDLLSRMTTTPAAEELDQYFADEATIVGQSMEIPYQQWRNQMIDHPIQVTDFEIETALEGENGIAAHVTERGHQTEELFGIPASDEEIEASHLYLCKIENEQITELVVFEATNQILDQLDVLNSNISSIAVQNQYLMILNRVLRHNLRTSVNLIDAHASSVTDAESTAAEEIQNITTDLLNMAEKARTLQEATIDTDPSPEPVDVKSIVRETIADFDEEVKIDVQSERKSDPGPTVYTDQRVLRLVLREVIENAVVHTETATSPVTVSVRERNEENKEMVEITVIDSGTGIPAEELKPIQQREETQLQHTSGIGLWIARLGITRLNGDIHFETGDGEGTTVRIQIPELTTFGA